MKRPTGLQAAFILILGLYPVIVYFGIRVLPAGFFGLLLLALLIPRVLAAKMQNQFATLPVLLIFLVYALAAALLGRTEALLWYPVLVNIVLCAVFSFSLIRGEALLIGLVRARGAGMSEHAIPYLRRLTAVWAGFFGVNSLVAIWTTTRSMETWTLYNGAISYVLIGLLVAGEMVFRNRYKRRHGVSGS